MPKAPWPRVPWISYLPIVPLTAGIIARAPAGPRWLEWRSHSLPAGGARAGDAREPIDLRLTPRLADDAQPGAATGQGQHDAFSDFRGLQQRKARLAQLHALARGHRGVGDAGTHGVDLDSFGLQRRPQRPHQADHGVLAH